VGGAEKGEELVFYIVPFSVWHGHELVAARNVLFKGRVIMWGLVVGSTSNILHLLDLFMLVVPRKQGHVCTCCIPLVKALHTASRAAPGACFPEACIDTWWRYPCMEAPSLH
jgi:hypothetical protein